MPTADIPRVPAELPLRRVLIADDDRTVLQLVKTVLSRARFAVDTATNGSQALTKMAAVEYAVVVLDLMMPETSGFDVLKVLEGRERKSRFVVVMSAASQSVVDSAVGSNVFASMRKPFEIDEMVSTVRACSRA